MSGADFAPIIQAVVALIAAVITGMIGIFVPRAIAAFEARTHITLTEQQQATVLGAAQTAAGILQTKLDQGAMKLSGIKVDDPTVLMEAAAAVARVPNAAAALEKDVPSMAATIVGLVDTTPKPVVALIPPAVPLAPLLPKAYPP